MASIAIAQCAEYQLIRRPSLAKALADKIGAE